MSTTPLSLLSLSIAAESAEPISLASGSSDSNVTTPKQTKPQHRRVSSSVGQQTKKKITEVREASSRPSPAALHTASSALSSLAALSLSASSLPDEDVIGDQAEAKLDEMGISVSFSKSTNGKKRSTIFKCETCSKVYRHPSCLIKHRWEHSPHWREASKFLLSKHQQVQMLEAAAILSHISPGRDGGTSLPADRALWPAYLSQESPVAHSAPKMHDFVLDADRVSCVRPGVLGVPTELSSSPVAVPRGRGGKQSEGSWGGLESWSLPGSSIRSESTSPPTEDDSMHEINGKMFEKDEVEGWDDFEMDMDP